MVVLAAGVGVAQPAASGDSRAPADAAAADPVSGIDVSAYQGLVDWQAVKASGVRFAYVRASEQANTSDAAFATNYANAKAQGLLVGAYHRARPDVSGGRAQADYFLDHAQFTNDGRTLPPVVDMEWPRAGWISQSGKPLGSCYDLTATQLVSWTRAFLAEVSTRTGRLGTIYTSTSWWNLCTGGDQTFGQNPLWIARYSASPLPLPAGWSNFTFWQYTSSGTLPNGTPVDRDVFREDGAALGWLARGAPVVLTGWVDPRYQHVVYGSADGHIHELYFRLNGSRWHQNDLTVKVGAAPAMRGSALTSWVDHRYQHVVYVSGDRHVRELYFPLTGGRWKQSDLTVAAAAPPTRPGSALTSWADHKYQHVVFGSADGHIRELYYRLAGGAWRQTDLSAITLAPPAVTANALGSWIAAGHQHVVYLSSGGHARDLHFPLGGGAWKESDLTAAAGAPPAAAGSALSSWVDHKYQHVVYLASTGSARELYAPAAGGTWKQTDLTRSSRASPAIPGSALSSWVDHKYQHVVYMSADQGLRELYFPLTGGHWNPTDLTSAVHGPPVALGSTVCSWIDQKYQHVVYVAGDGHVDELYFPLAGGRWKQNDLTGSAGAPAAVPGSAMTS